MTDPQNQPLKRNTIPVFGITMIEAVTKQISLKLPYDLFRRVEDRANEREAWRLELTARPSLVRAHKYTLEREGMDPNAKFTVSDVIRQALVCYFKLLDGDEQEMWGFANDFVFEEVQRILAESVDADKLVKAWRDANLKRGYTETESEIDFG